METRQRLTKWSEDGQHILGRVQGLLQESQSLVSLIHGLLEQNEQLRARVEATEQECERLRLESTTIRSERDDIIGAFGKLLGEMLQPMNEMMQKIRGMQRRSPFERDRRPAPASELTPVASSQPSAGR
ncbi:MAG: hypothetical protein HY726_09215 [Candidatus Rokubacteria bacterium]|nr:hypothetical protein [Candidatus Rokubacteria bacterium]